MFFAGVLLVAGLNLYAVVREAELVPIDEVGQHVQSIIRVEGELVSWVADPYDDGSDLKKLVLLSLIHI